MEAYLHKLSHFIQHRPYLSLLMTCGGIYTLYYMTGVVKKPQIICKDKRLLHLITQHCPISAEQYWPTWWCFEAHILTLLRSFLQSNPHTMFHSEYLRMPDGGQVKLDWVDSNKNYHPSSSRPTVLIMPGLTGSSQEGYIRHLVEATTDLGYRCVVFNNRGNGGCELLTKRTYCAANTEDLECVMKHIRKTFPDAPIIGAGVSLGGVILLNYLAKTGEESGMCAGMCVSVVWDLMESAASLQKPINILCFNRYLTYCLVEKIERNRHMFEDVVDMDQVLKSKTIREFDTHFTSKIFGYDSCDHYYKDASPYCKIHSLRVPVLALNAADDPFVPMHSNPVKEAQTHDNIAIVITSHGGHIGFLEGTFPRNKSYLYRWFSQYIDAIFKHWTKHQ